MTAGKRAIQRALSGDGLYPCQVRKLSDRHLRGVDGRAHAGVRCPLSFWPITLSSKRAVGNALQIATPRIFKLITPRFWIALFPNWTSLQNRVYGRART